MRWLPVVDAKHREMLPKGLGLQRRSAIALSVAVSCLHLARNTPEVFLRPINVYDEGARLAHTVFASRGLIPFRDYLEPYGPGRDYLGSLARWLGFDTVVANRMVFLLAGAALAGLITFLMGRRRGIGAGLFFGLLAVFFEPANAFYGETHTLVLLLMVVALVVLEETRIEHDLAPLVDESPLADRRVLLAGSVLGLAAWFRYEFGLLVVVWLVLMMIRPKPPVRLSRFRPWFMVPVLVASLPYVVIVLLGGLRGMVTMVGYVFSGRAQLIFLPIDWIAGLDVVRALGHIKRPDMHDVVAALSLSALVVAGVLLILTLIARRWGRLKWLELTEKDDSRASAILIAATVVMGQVIYRADTVHLTHLIIPVWLVLGWSRRGPGWSRSSVALGVVAVTFVSAGIGGFDGWSEIGRFSRSEPLLTRLGDVPTQLKLGDADVALVLDEPLVRVVEAWRADNSPDRVFVANRSNSFTPWNAPLVYYVLDARPASWLTMFVIGVTDQSSFHADIVADLCRTRAPLVLLETPTDAKDAPIQFSPDLDRFIALNYDLFAGGDSVMEYRRFVTGSSCLQIEDASPDVIRSRLTTVEGLGDVTAASSLQVWLATKPSDS